MTPDLDGSAGVIARVVAWHNRHPLAERISAAQVHSVGVLSLPFAVRGARIELVPEPAEPPADAEPPAAAAQGLSPDHAAAAAADPAPAIELFAPAAVDLRVAMLPRRPRSWHPLTWWRRWRGRDPFHALFSEDFIAPLRPARVARFVAAHGVGERPLQPPAPQRSIAQDRRRLRPGDDATEVELHVITAAIGLGESRNRVLLAPGAESSILGSRHWSRARLAAAAAPSAVVLLLAGAGLWWRPATQPDLPAAVAQVAPVMASASAASACVAALPASAASAVTVVQTAAQAASTAPAILQAPVVSQPASARAQTPPRQAAQVLALARPPEPKPAAAASAHASRPGVGKVCRAGIELPPLVPLLTDSYRRALREAGHKLRRPAAAVPPPPTAWALATRPMADKHLSARAAAQLHALALLQPQPMRSELVQARSGWRAVFWPFHTARDAEKARQALADKGLRTELIEF